MGFWSYIGRLLKDAGGPAPTAITSNELNVVSVPMLPAPTLTVAPKWLVLCRPLTEHFEACYLIAYCDPASDMAKALQADGLWYKYLADRSIGKSAKYLGLRAGPWTIGYGQTGSSIVQDTVWTQIQADNALTAKLQEEGDAVDRLVTAELLPHQKAAITDWSYNEGEGHLAQSTMLKRLNDKNFGEAMSELLTWDIAGGRESAGLAHRRIAEKTLFTTGAWSP